MKNRSVFVAFAIWSMLFSTAFAQNQATVPRLMNFSGNAGTDLKAGTAGVTFSIYREQTGGAPLWMETQTVTADGKGNFIAQLGATKTSGLPLELFASGEARWLGVRVNGGEEQARVLLLSVPYALKAADAETVGGLPASAFMLAAPAGGTALPGTNGTSPSDVTSATSSNVTTTGGAVNSLPLFTTATNVQSSAITQTGTGTAAKIGINNAAPAATLDVKGPALIRGNLGVTSTGNATATAGKISQPIQFTASSFNSTSSAAVNQNLRWQAEPVSNNTASPSATLNFLYGSGTTTPVETGLRIASNGQITFASGQLFPGTGPGTITGITAGTDLTGGGTSGTVTLNLDTTKVPLLAKANTFHGDQSIVGNVNLSTGFGIKIGGMSFASGDFPNENILLGFAGNSGVSGFQNTAIGTNAMELLTSGARNTATGFAALGSNQAGSYNTADGAGALGATYGSYNTGTGAFVMLGNGSGSDNTADGYNALGVSNGNDNTAIGYQSLASSTTPSFNTAVGSQSLYSNTTAAYNTAVGYQAMYSNTGTSNPNQSQYNSAFGFQAMYSNTTGTQNTASGYQSMYFNSIGFFNTATGYQSLYKSNGGNQNTAEGYQALYSDNIGSLNTATGYQSLFNDTGGTHNTADGALALAAVILGSNDTAVGDEALANSNSGDNTAVGYEAASSVSSGDENTAVGSQALQQVSTGSGNTCVGFQCGLGANNLSNATAIGAHAIAGVSNSLVLGGTGRYAVKVGIGTSEPTAIFTIAQGAGHPVSDSWETYSSQRWKTNIHTLPNALSKVEKLRGVSYDMKDSGKHEIGVIAEEVGAVVPELVTYESNGKDARSVDYARLTALLIEATKQQQQEIQQQRELLHAQAATSRKQMQMLQRQQAAIHDLAAKLKETQQTLQKVREQVPPAAMLARK